MGKYICELSGEEFENHEDMVRHREIETLRLKRNILEHIGSIIGLPQSAYLIKSGQLTLELIKNSICLCLIINLDDKMIYITKTDFMYGQPLIVSGHSLYDPDSLTENRILETIKEVLINLRANNQTFIAEPIKIGKYLFSTEILIKVEVVNVRPGFSSNWRANT